jgi:hypothetical protein
MKWVGRLRLEMRCNTTHMSWPDFLLDSGMQQTMVGSSLGKDGSY